MLLIYLLTFLETLRYFIQLIPYIFFLSIYSQNKTNTENYYEWFDSVIGINNTALLNGIEFKEKYRTLDNNDQYFLSRQFLPGNLIYDTQPYYDMELKYDINEDEIIIKLSENSGYFALRLIKELVESFQINNHIFLNTSYLSSNGIGYQDVGFCEVLFRGSNIVVLKKHLKNKYDRRNERLAYTEFIYRNKYLIFYEDNFFDLNSKKDLIKLFPKQKKLINSFYKNKRYLMESIYDDILSKLGEELNKNIIKN